MKSALYWGRVRHRRFTPKVHAFTYSLLYFYLDLAEVERIFRIPFLFARKGPSLMAFRRRDYLGQANESLLDSVKRTVREQLGREVEGPVRMLTQISYFGFCFNPISLYYCFDASDTRVAYIVAQVTNTPWHERHVYAVEARPGEPLDFSVHKAFHVSPFMPMQMRYRWTLNVPGEALNVHMENYAPGADEPVFDATLTLRRRPLDGFQIAIALIKFPLLTLKAYPAIYWQAARLALKRIPFFTHPLRGEKA